jgi:hypothetical protein
MGSSQGEKSPKSGDNGSGDNARKSGNVCWQLPRIAKQTRSANSIFIRIGKSRENIDKIRETALIAIVIH